MRQPYSVRVRFRRRRPPCGGGASSTCPPSNSRNQLTRGSQPQILKSPHLEDAAADGDIAGEGALLVHVVALPGRLGGLEPEANVLHEPHALALRGWSRVGT